MYCNHDTSIHNSLQIKFSIYNFHIGSKAPNYKFLRTAATNRIKPYSIELESCHSRRGLKHFSSIVPRFFSMLASWRRISPFSHVKQKFPAFSFGFAPSCWRWRDFGRVAMVRRFVGLLGFYRKKKRNIRSYLVIKRGLLKEK